MRDDPSSVKVDALRRAFDAAFTQERTTRFERVERLVAVRVARDGFALRINEIAALHAMGNVTALPDTPSGLLGLVGVRGQIAAAWDLATLLGYGDVGETRRWLVLSAPQRDLALALGHVEGYLRVEISQLHEVAAADSADGQLQQAFDHGGTLRRILSVPAILANVHRIIARAAGAP